MSHEGEAATAYFYPVDRIAFECEDCGYRTPVGTYVEAKDSFQFHCSANRKNRNKR